MNLRKEIDAYLDNHPGSKARIIAKSIGVEKSVVNSFLFANDHLYEKDANHFWYKKGTFTPAVAFPLKPSDPLLRKLQLKEFAESYSIAEFETIADWTNMASPSPEAHKYEFEIWCGPRAGSKIVCDSKAEIKLLKYLKTNDLVLDVAGQSLRIPYDSAFLKNKDYYPDIVVLTKDYHIAIIEVKASTAMAQHMNMEKYEALDDYCYNHGYEYMMVDPDNHYMTFEDLWNMPVNPDLHEIFMIMEEERVDIENDPTAPYLMFDNDDVDQWYKEYGKGTTKSAFQLQVHSLVACYDWYNFFPHGFRAYSRPVLLSKEYEVLSWI